MPGPMNGPGVNGVAVGPMHGPGVNGVSNGQMHGPGINGVPHNGMRLLSFYFNFHLNSFAY